VADNIITLKVELGALTEVPCFCHHERGKNWCAEISRDPDSPGGLSRDWWRRGKGEFYYKLPQDVKTGVPIEFGGDYYTGGGKPRRERRWFVLTKVEPHQITLEEYATPIKAIKAAEVFNTPKPEEKPVTDHPVPDEPKVGAVHTCIPIMKMCMHLVFTGKTWDLYRGESTSGPVNFCPGCGVNMESEQ